MRELQTRVDPFSRDPGKARSWPGRELAVALAFHERGDLAGAEGFYRRFPEGREHTLGKDSPDAVVAAALVAALLFDEGDFAGAEPLYRRTVAAHGHATGPARANLLNDMDCLAKPWHLSGGGWRSPNGIGATCGAAA